MVARDGRSGRRVRVGGQRPPAAPRREHVRAADLQLGREVAPNLVEQVPMGRVMGASRACQGELRQITQQILDLVLVHL